ncbi:MAG: DNA photolyase [Bacillota bacterium]|nr:DNA photolyase [Bacillota bacterium]
MKKYFKSLIKDKNMFNSIYVEEAAFRYPITNSILNKYDGCPVIKIKHYKDVFNRSNQHFGIQKQHQSLILAVKDKQFLYKGPDVCQNFGRANFYYTSFLLNCIYNCEYCYLQGMYQSANLVAFVNIEDYKLAINDALSNGALYLAVSYDTDLIAFNKVLPYLDHFYEFFEKKPDLEVEIRTKSANVDFYKNHKPLDNVIMAFTISPDKIIKNYERLTPPLNSRIKAIKTAIEYGFKVRICFDPIFIGDDLNDLYEPFFNHVFSEINSSYLFDVGYGFFRMSREFFRKIEKQYFSTQIFSDEYCRAGEVVSYRQELRDEFMRKHFQILNKYIDKEKIFIL